LIAIDISESLDDLNPPPSNHWETMRGDRSGQYSIRINNQWRICFTCKGSNADDVEIVDYPWIRERPRMVQMQGGNEVDYPGVISTS